MRSTSADVTADRYRPSDKGEWNAFVAGARDATFLFDRDYMDYHADRFVDHSIVVRRSGRLIACLPANERGDGMLVSHGGLTYGGLAQPADVDLTASLDALAAVLDYAHGAGFPKLLYKRVPAFYNPGPADDIAFAMFLLDAHRYRVDVTVVVQPQARLPLAEQRRRALTRAERAGLSIVEGRMREFWSAVLTPNLAARHGVRPAHSIDEMELLAGRFPNRIHQFGVTAGDALVGGATIYETDRVAHAQYIAATDEGRRLGALDLLFARLISERFADKPFFDFGIVNEMEGRAVNVGLLRWKEGFGGRVMAHEFYEIDTTRGPRLAAALDTQT